MYVTRPSVMTNGRMSSLTYQIEKQNCTLKIILKRKIKTQGGRKNFKFGRYTNLVHACYTCLTILCMIKIYSGQITKLP